MTYPGTGRLRGALSCLLLGLAGCATTLPPPPPPPPPLPVPAGLELPAFELHTLPNGLRIVTVENHAHPIIGLTAYVTTGGRTESAHFAGALHFIEHLVFKGGTIRFPPTAFRKRIAALGDENGGWTWDDEIQFGFEVPKRNFAEALDIFSESLLELQWSERWFEDERKVVLQEIEKVSERPWHRLWNAWDRAAFTRHPYGRPVIGDAATIRAQTMEGLEAYYRERFTPNHLVLIVVGDFETQELLVDIEREFAHYVRGPDSFELENVAEPEPTEGRVVRQEYSGTTDTRFLLGFRTPGAAHEDTPGLLLLAKLLSSPTEGVPATLTRKHQWVTSVGADYTFMVDYGHLMVQGEVEPGKADTVLAWLRRTMTTLGDRPFSEQAVREAARELLTDRARAWEGFGHQAQGLGFWIERMGPDAARQATPRILAQTPESLAALARKYCQPRRLVEAVMWPPGSRSEAIQVVAARDQPPPVPSLMQPGLLQAAEAPPWEIRERGQSDGVVAYDVGPGLTLLVHQTHANSLLSTVAWVSGGQWVEPPEQAGVGVLTARTLTSGTAHLSVSEWDRLLGSLAVAHSSALRFGERTDVPRNVHARDGATVALSGTADQLEPVMALLGEAIFRPTFPAVEVAKARRVLLSEIDALRENNLEYIKQEFYAQAFGEHPYGRPTIGDRTTVAALTADEVRAFHAAHWTADRVVVGVVGNVAPRRVAELIATRWADAPTRRAGALPAASAPPVRPQSDQSRLLALGRDQWCVNIGFPTLAASVDDFPALEVVTAIARGRHFYKYVYELGVSYRSWIKLWPHRGASAWILENDVARDGFDATLDRMRADLADYATGTFSSEDVELARMRLLNRSVLDRQSGQRVAFDLARGVGLGLPYDHLSRRRRALRAVTREQVNRLARTIFGRTDRYEVLLK